MKSNNMMETVDAFQTEVKGINSKALSNGLLSDEASDLFGKFDGKMNSIKTGISKAQGIEESPYEYASPKAGFANKNVNSDLIKSELTFTKERLTKFRENLKNEKYKVVDSSKNTITYLNSTTKGLFTKSIKDLEELIELF